MNAWPPVFVTPAADVWLNRALATTVTVDLSSMGSTANILSSTLEHTYTSGGTAWLTTGISAVSYTTVPWYASPTGANQVFATWTIAANTWADEDVIQLRARVQENGGFFPQSAWTYLNLRAANLPAAPTFVSPAAGANVNKTFTVTWTPAEAQSGYDIEVWTGAGATGTRIYQASVEDSNPTHVVTMDVTGVTRYIRVRTRYHGLSGAVAERNVVTLFLAPEVPTFTTSKIDPSALGISDTILFTITNPTPTGGKPAVTDMWIEYRKQGSSDPWIMLDSSIGLSTPYRWRAPNGAWEFRVTSYAASIGTSTQSATGQPQTITIQGVVLTVPGTLTGLWIVYNDSGASEGYQVESALIQYQGRTYPVAEYGSSRSLEISVGHATLLTTAEKELLVSMADDVILYRDAKGRSNYGHLALGAMKDRSFGYECDFLVTVVDDSTFSKIVAV